MSRKIKGEAGSKCLLGVGLAVAGLLGAGCGGGGSTNGISMAGTAMNPTQQTVNAPLGGNAKPVTIQNATSVSYANEVRNPVNGGMEGSIFSVNLAQREALAGLASYTRDGRVVVVGSASSGWCFNITYTPNGSGQLAANAQFQNNTTGQTMAASVTLDTTHNPPTLINASSSSDGNVSVTDSGVTTAVLPTDTGGFTVHADGGSSGDVGLHMVANGLVGGDGSGYVWVQTDSKFAGSRDSHIDFEANLTNGSNSRQEHDALALGGGGAPPPPPPPSSQIIYGFGPNPSGNPFYVQIPASSLDALFLDFSNIPFNRLSDPWLVDWSIGSGFQLAESGSLATGGAVDPQVRR